MIRNMRRISLFVLIAFTLSTLFFQVVHIGYADNHPPTREEFEALEEKVKELTDRDATDVILDVIYTGCGVVTAAVGFTVATSSVAADSTIVGIPAGTAAKIAGGTGMAVGGAAVYVSGGNLLSDIGNVLSSASDAATGFAVDTFRRLTPF